MDPRRARRTADGRLDSGCGCLLDHVYKLLDASLDHDEMLEFVRTRLTLILDVYDAVAVLRDRARPHDPPGRCGRSPGPGRRRLGRH